MASYEMRGEASVDPGLLAPDYFEMLLVDIVVRNNTGASEVGDGAGIHDWNMEKFLPPKLITPGTGNEVAIQIRPKMGSNGIANINLGFYSPIDRGFVIFPDLLEGNEAEIILAAAELQRRQDLEHFTERESINAYRIDYDDDLVQGIHTEHDRYFAESDMLVEVINKVNENRASSDEYRPTLVDYHSQAVVCLRPDSMSTNREHYIGIKIMGSYLDIHGFKRRHSTHYINIAEANPDEEALLDFMPYNGMIRGYEIPELEEMVQELFKKAVVLDLTDGIKLDTQSVGFERHPSVK